MSRGGQGVTQRLEHLLRRRPDLLPGVPVANHTLVRPSDGSSGDVWIAQSEGQSVAVIRRCEIRRAAKRLLWAHTLAECVDDVGGRRPLPRLLSAEMSRWRTRGVGGPVIVEEWLEGNSLASVPEGERLRHAPALAQALRVLHSVRAPAWGGPGERPRVDFGPRLDRMIAHRLTFLEAHADLLAPLPFEHLTRWLRSKREAMPSHRDFALVHNHIAEDDLLIHPTGQVMMIDIGSLQFGPPEPDLVAGLHALAIPEGDAEPLLGPYLAHGSAEEGEEVRCRLPLFLVLRDLSKLRSLVRKGCVDTHAAELASIRGRVLRAVTERFPLRSGEGSS
jgi:aminoglycoside phosphotransferase (APT) family kinase protein